MSALVSKLEAASAAYHNGQPLLMTDAEFDDAVTALRASNPAHPFLTKVGAALPAELKGEEVLLPIPLSSLNKVKAEDAITKWISGCQQCTEYHISLKLDGCSALWIPATKKLYTRGDGIRGRDISAFVPYFQGLVASSSSATAVRGELIMRSDSAAIPPGKLARNIVAGALNRKEADPALFAEIRFVAYELLTPLAAPSQAYALMRGAGFEVARSTLVPVTDLTEAALSTLFSASEAKSQYQIDGIVLAPNTERPTNWKPTPGKNPVDRVAWKTRSVTVSASASASASAKTTVRSVEWNVSHQGNLIPRVLFDTVTLAGANISAATGLHGRWIYDNGIGPGALIEVRRAGDVIPQIIAVHIRCPTGPAMPARFAWASDSLSDVHIKPVGDDSSTESACIRITHALAELGAENVGPGLVAKLYAAGFTTVGLIYAGTAAAFESRVEGCKGKMAERIWQGLRSNQDKWTELNFMVASCTMPRGVGHTKLRPLLAAQPNPALWSSTFAGAMPGLSEKTIGEIIAAIPAYLEWKAATGLSSVPLSDLQVLAAPGPRLQVLAAPVLAKQKVVVFTGVRDKELEAALIAAGHIVADTVTKKTTHLVTGSTDSTSTKVTKARAAGVNVQTLVEFKTDFGV